jgi:hypothetical protein
MTADAVTLVTDSLTALNERRLGDCAAAYAESAVIEYPQSGERITGRDNIRGMLEDFSTPPTFTIRRAFGGDGDRVVVEFDVDYGMGGQPWKGVAIYTVTRGSIDNEVAYFGEPFEPPDWRAPFR